MSRTWNEHDYCNHYICQENDKIKSINILLKDIERGNFEGIGKPEPLKGELSGFWSRRIDDVNRLVYRISDDVLEIVSCKGHYED